MNPPISGLPRPFFIAEIGGNHEGSFERAKILLELAAESGAHAVKFQTYKGDLIVNKVVAGERNKHFKKFELTEEQWLALIRLAEQKGVLFMSSVWDEESLDFIDSHVKLHKVGSGDLTNYPLIERILEKGKPVIFSTAMATMSEIRNLVQFVMKKSPLLIQEQKIALLHCVATYGEPKREYANLKFMQRLQQTFPQLPIGYSDHTEGIEACRLALKLGASIIEKHFTDDKRRAFRDHQLSATKKELQTLIEAGGSGDVKDEDLLLGNGEDLVTAVEIPARIKEFRRAVYPSRDLEAGATLTSDNLITLRPNEGIDAREYYKLLGRKLRVEKKMFEPLYEEELQ